MRIADRISSEHNDNLKGFIREAIIANSDVRMEVDEGDSETHTANYIAKGQGLECAMINFLTQNGEDVYNNFKTQNADQDKIF